MGSAHLSCCSRMFGYFWFLTNSHDGDERAVMVAVMLT